MLDRKLAGHALSLTWRFLLCFLAMIYPLHSYRMTLIEAGPLVEGGPIPISAALFVLSLQILVPFVIPFLSMYAALAWYNMRIGNEA